MVENGEITCVYSDLTEAELENAPENVKERFNELVKTNSEYVQVTEDSFLLPQKYVMKKLLAKQVLMIVDI